MQVHFILFLKLLYWDGNGDGTHLMGQGGHRDRSKWGWGQTHGNGVGMETNFVPVSLSTVHPWHETCLTTFDIFVNILATAHFTLH